MNFERGGLDRGQGRPNKMVHQSCSPEGFLTLSNTKTSRDDGLQSLGTDRHRLSRLNLQQNLFRSIDNLSRISDKSDRISVRNETRNDCQKVTLSNANATTGFPSWIDVNEVVFSCPQIKRVKRNVGAIDQHINAVATQFHFGLPDAELRRTGNIGLEIHQDVVPYKIRAKRGCATQPRSVAERDRRTRISGKLKKLQDLVPKTDKQTTYADMLDLAVQHINDLQCRVQKLNKELKNCTCRLKQIK